MIKILENKHSGFTLIEIILTLIIAAVVGAGLVQYLGTALTQSSVPIQRLNQSLGLQQVMENITADYEKNYRFNLNTLKSNIGGAGPQTNSYGEYVVVENNFIKFVSQVETDSSPSDPKDILKVTIENNLGEILTTLFREQ